MCVAKTEQISGAASGVFCRYNRGNLKWFALAHGLKVKHIVLKLYFVQPTMDIMDAKVQSLLLLL